MRKTSVFFEPLMLDVIVLHDDSSESHTSRFSLVKETDAERQTPTGTKTTEAPSNRMSDEADRRQCTTS